MTSPQVPAGWYQDPAQRHEYRYWDGSAWTGMVSDQAVVTTDPLSGQSAAGQGPAGQAGPPTLAMTEPTGPPQVPAPGQAPGWVQGQPAQWQPGASGQWQGSPSGQWQGGPSGQWQQVPGANCQPGPGGQWPTPATAPRPPTPGRRNRVVAAVAAAVVVLALVIGLVVWAPWKVPPVLQPTGLAAGVATTSAAAFRWAPPPSGPLPDKYLILYQGHVIGSVKGSVTSYQVGDLAPASTYQYRVVAERGGKRSPWSAPVTVQTVVPPVSDGRLQGAWNVAVKVLSSGGEGILPAGKAWTDSWMFDPQCLAGPCGATLSGHISPPGYQSDFTVNLTRSGAVYTGRTTTQFTSCSGVADKDVLNLRITVSQSGTQGKDWLATSWSGTMTMNAPYASVGSNYCSAATWTFAISGSP